MEALRLSRRGLLATGLLMATLPAPASAVAESLRRMPKVIGNPFAYQRVHTVGLDPMPELDVAFADFKAVGYQGVELYPYNLQIDGAVEKLAGLIERRRLPLTGCSFTGEMWRTEQRAKVLSDATALSERLARLGGRTMTINVGDAGRGKTPSELASQAQTLAEVLQICRAAGLQPALHNHVHELADDQRELKTMFDRIPDLPLCADLNWVLRAGVDPVAFIRQYGPRIVYLHLRDQDPQGRWTEALGEGVTDFPNIAKALRNCGFGGDAAVELLSDPLWPKRLGVRGAYGVSRRYVRQVFGW